MSDQRANFMTVTGFAGGVSVGIYADTYEEYCDRWAEVYDGDTEKARAVADSLFASLANAGSGQAVQQVQRATNVVTGAFPQAQQSAPSGDRVYLMHLPYDKNAEMKVAAGGTARFDKDRKKWHVDSAYQAAVAQWV